MSDLDLGTLVARLKLEGAQQYNRDVDKARNSFADLADAAQRADRQAGTIKSPKGLTEITRDADKAKAAVSDIGDGAQRTSTRIAGVGDGMSRARRQISSDAQAARRDISQIGDSARSVSTSVEGSSSRMGNAFRSSLEGLGDHVGEAGGGAGSAFMAGFAPKIAQLGSKAGPIGAAVAGIAAIGIGAGVMFAKAVSDGFEIQSQRTFAQTKFGLTDQQMEQAGLAAGNAYGQTFGESVQANIDTAGVAMQTGLLKGNATADQMQPVIESLTTVSKLMGTEIPETARAAGQMVKTGLVKNSAEAMDLLIVAQQKGLNQNGDLLDSIGEYSSQWQKLGIDGETALGTIAQMQTAGVRNTDLAADALKEFSIRAIDGSQSTRDAFTSLGLDADQAGQAFAAGGDQALGMSRTVLLALANVKDPMERNRIGTELMGTQWEDTGKAINKLDLAKARDELGRVDGAAKAAGDSLSNGPGAAIESVKRKIEVAVDGIKVKLAEAFGPAAEDFSAWFTEHQDEIVEMLTTVARYAGIAAGQATAFTGAIIIGLGKVSEYVGIFARETIGRLGKFGETLGGIMKHIPGLQKSGDAMEAAGKKAQQLSQQYIDNGRAAQDFGQKTLDAGNKISAMSAKIGAAGDSAVTTTGRIGNLTVAVTDVPDAKSIIITDNSPETKKNLEALGYKVETLPDGTVKVTANTEAAQRDLDTITKQREAVVNVRLKLPDGTYATNMDNLLPGAQGGNSAAGTAGSAWDRAGGGQVFGPGGPKDDLIPVNLSNREFVHQVAAVDYYGTGFMSAVNSMQFPRVLAQGFADGGQVGYGLPSGSSGSDAFPDWITALGGQYGVKPSTYAGHQESDRAEAGYAPNPQHLNRGIDWSGSVDQMQSFAEAMMARAVSDPAIEQVIWQNPNTGQKLGWHGRQPDTDGSYFANDYAQHQNHVHTRFSSQVGAAVGAQGAGAGVQTKRTIPLKQNPDGTWSSTDPAWDHLIQRESGGKADIVQQGQDANSGGNEASGLFQIAKGTWGAYGGTKYAPTAGQATPDQQAEIATAIFDKEGGSPWGAGMAGREDEAVLRAGIKTTTVGGSGDFGGTGMPVQVTNWPSGFGSGSSSSSTSSFSSSYDTPSTSAKVPDVDNKTRPTDADLASGQAAVGEAERAVTAAQAAQKVAQTKLDTAKPQDRAAAQADLDKANEAVTDAQANAQTSRDLMADLQARHDNFAGAPDRSEVITKQAELAQARRDLTRLQAEQTAAEKAATDARNQHKSPVDIATADGNVTKARNAVASAESKIKELEAAVAQAQRESTSSARQRKGELGKNPLPIVAYADGSHDTEATTGPRMWALAGEAGPEAIIPLSPAKRQRALDLWAKTGKRIGVQTFADGGFGGYQEDTSDWMAPKSWMDWIYLASGAGFTAASAIAPYASIAYDFATDGAGSVSLGDLAPQPSTSSNDVPLVAQAVGDATSALSQQLDDIKKAIQEGKTVRIQVEDAKSLLRSSGIHLAAMG